MMQFEVRAIAADNTVARLTVEALDEAQARQQVQGRGMTAATLRPMGAGGTPGWLRARGAGPRFSVVLFSQELLALLEAGLSIVEALEALLEKEAQDSTRSVLTQLLSGLREGRRLSVVMAGQPQVFPALFVGVVRTAEGTSDLPRSLARFIDYEQRLSLVRNKVVSAAIYPSILMLVGGAVSLFLVGFVVPRFAEVYQGTGRSLPWMSQLLLDWGQFAAAHWRLVLIGAALALVGAVTSLRNTIRTVGLAGLIAKLPGMGERVRIYELSRLYLTLGMLIEGGIAIVAAIEIVSQVMARPQRLALQQAKAMVESGMPLSAAFESQDLTTPISLRLLRVGERTGDMGALLLKSAAFYDGEIGRWIDRFSRSFEPLLMAAIGLVVGVIVVMLYMPIFDLAGNM
jgi:general secretion pathway protein F